MKFIIQYSIQGNDPNITTWKEYEKTITAGSIEEAINEFNRGREGSPWIILDCYPK